MFRPGIAGLLIGVSLLIAPVGQSLAQTSVTACTADEATQVATVKEQLLSAIRSTQPTVESVADLQSKFWGDVAPQLPLCLDALELKLEYGRDIDWIFESLVVGQLQQPKPVDAGKLVKPDLALEFEEAAAHLLAPQSDISAQATEASDSALQSTGANVVGPLPLTTGLYDVSVDYSFADHGYVWLSAVNSNGSTEGSFMSEALPNGTYSSHFPLHIRSGGDILFDQKGSAVGQWAVKINPLQDSDVKSVDQPVSGYSRGYVAVNLTKSLYTAKVSYSLLDNGSVSITAYDHDLDLPVGIFQTGDKPAGQYSGSFLISPVSPGTHFIVVESFGLGDWNISFNPNS